MKKIISIQIILILALLLIFFIYMRKTAGSQPTVAVIPSAPFKMQSAATIDEFSLINPAVVHNLGKHYIINFKPLKDTFTSIQKRYSQKTYVYFAYLNNVSWVGLNEKEDFTAASTIKVPIAMSLMKAVEDNKLQLSDSYGLEELDLDSGFGDLYKVGADKEFTVEELLAIMLQKSDNTALNAIVEIFHRVGIENPLGDAYGFLGWEFTQSIPEIGETPDYSKINLKTLANLFLALYDAKYITIEHSHKILTYLTRSDFNDRIVAGVPSHTVVSHKIGTAVQDNTFSDCGIVYVPNRNYLLCLGSTGADEKKAGNFMAEISRAAYEYVIKN